MRGLKMAELQFEAPLATFESEEWNDFNDFQTVTEVENSNKNPKPSKGTNEKNDNNLVAENHFGETVSGSLEDLVNTFDEKITKCFCNFEEKVEKFAPVQIRTQEEIMNDCQMWWTITGNFGNLLPIDWSKSYARQLHTRALNLSEKKETETTDLDLPDDDELAEAFDMHSLIISSLNTDEGHLATADEVINEIEHMMQDSPSEESPEEEEEISEEMDSYTKVKETLKHLQTITETEMKSMSTAALNELLAQFELTIKELSETLVTELALRDELEYDKELKNQFISLLLTLQKKRRENNVDKKKKRVKVNNALAEGAGTYLTTVIPYHPFLGPPASEQLQIYIKILQAINEDSSQVPTLLTDYILKVLCPT
ncbi:Hypothetical predicted protein [Octopus vulgaris]|uniref:Fasciculation and elongation protein zeta-2 n=1 Tax=Octopus vulgaris TaxID=6645 RepID=A0AA36AWP3_OCTVU|nr:Hypothetical predicted protein [Octopus vulgaris]CAI9723691.1 Hypothetical predicted protein [Octopus vulgaris]